MKYPVVLHTDDDMSYSVTVPDVPGCFSAGYSFDEALDMVAEAIFGHLEILLEDGEDIPKASPIAFHKDNPDYADGVWAVVDVDINPLLGKSEKINVTLPHLLITKIDKVVATNPKYKTRSGFLAEASKKILELA
ncbi:type II toxin-antitoxin system HicB family antitoxin [Maribrevibacterium harenarium]|uniref:Type II toxin-antitoxin system HicB family antitoxin n=1 Tax=Maribrevibacterium harenarium TaxID=2589817 RepID=A0A501WYD1_9GAMM|nr:type II toxin-antitoxin system HicB family antitoxin [Maribrevibacterium harenarium]TPE54269.1 type II toxin-antitoxin system HicB family antitoxin [Maribrevibacterium harenarium]